MSVQVGPRPNVEVISSKVEHLEDARWWYEKTTEVLRIGDLEPATWVRTRSISKFKSWYCCQKCGSEWASNTHVDEFCGRCNSWEHIEYLGERPEKAPW